MGDGDGAVGCLGGAGGVDIELVARLSCVGFFHTVGLKEYEKETSVMSLVIGKLVQCSYTEVCSEKMLYEKLFISYLFREVVGCQITPIGCPVLYP